MLCDGFKSPLKRSYIQRLINNWGPYHSLLQVNGVCCSHVQENITKVAAPKAPSRIVLERIEAEVERFFSSIGSGIHEVGDGQH